jgi:hypothetical protein
MLENKPIWISKVQVEQTARSFNSPIKIMLTNKLL